MNRKIVENNQDLKVMENRIVKILASGAILALKLRFFLILSHFQSILGFLLQNIDQSQSL